MAEDAESPDQSPAASKALLTDQKEDAKELARLRDLFNVFDDDHSG